MPNRVLALALCAGLAALASCFVPTLEELGEAKACDDAHACATGYVCLDGVCRAGSSSRKDAQAGGDASATDGSQGCRAPLPFCEGGRQYQCTDGSKALLNDCAKSGATCDDLRGCLSPCSTGICPSGFACDRATDLCVPRLACAKSSDCRVGACVAAGACVFGPNAEPSVVVSDGGLSRADLDCYRVDGGTPTDAAAPDNVDGGSLPDGGGPGGGDGGPPDAASRDTGELTATMRGLVLSATARMTPQTVGFTLRLFRAESFNASDAPVPFTTTTAFAGGDAGVGSFRVDGVPVNVELVVGAEGTGAVPTYQYLTLGIQQLVQVDGGMLADSVVLTSYDEALWTDLAFKQARAPKVTGRAGVVGQVFDCRPAGLRVANVSLGLTTPAKPYYTHPGVLGIDPAATATADNGRFFFFDVPVMRTTLVAVEHRGTTPVLLRSQEIRTVPYGVTLVNVRPR
jgi:hypothetical protein